MASRYDDPGVAPPAINLAVVGVLDDGTIRLSLTVGGKLERFTVPRNVAVTIISELATGLSQPRS